MDNFTSYPEGYNKLCKKLFPFFYPKKIKDMMMRMLLTILTDG